MDDVMVSRDRSLAHIASITAAVDLPVSADFMSGYGLEPEDVAQSVAQCVATGVAGLSIEDATGDSSSPLYDLPIAVERVQAARQAIDQSGEDVLLTARAECYHVSHPDPFRESVRRLQAYAAAGADVLFAPGPQNPAEIKALVEAVAPKPINLLVVRDIGLRVEEIAALGVRRISVGGALALAAWTGFIRAAQTLKSEGSFAGLADLVPYAEINGLFATDLSGHQAAQESAT
jgi:2-methylisocitrate lyase-like PEP mutase family enzyme